MVHWNLSLKTFVTLSSSWQLELGIYQCLCLHFSYNCYVLGQFSKISLWIELFQYRNIAIKVPITFVHLCSMIQLHSNKTKIKLTMLLRQLKIWDVIHKLLLHNNVLLYIQNSYASHPTCINISQSSVHDFWK